MAAAPTEPVRIEGRLEPELSRWLWLVKWLLAIPHYFLLFFLWVAFAVLTVVAFFAILFTGRYPHGIFEFNVGVLRWTWRVAFYSYGALGTDRYPPFSLGEEPDYPATLEVDYPGELSRGLVLVKWWLLAIPHYLLVGIFLGGGAYGVWATDDWDRGWGSGGGPGLIGLLVLFAAVALLFTSRYPRGIFDFVLGLDRWVARVAVYAGLMTDRYPPFRLDRGGSEPVAAAPADLLGAEAPGPAAAAAVSTEAAPAATAAPAAAAAPPRGAGKIALLVIGSIVALLALAALLAGVAAVVVDQVGRDDDGFLMSPSEDFETSGYAIVSERADVDTDDAQRALDTFLGTVRIRSESERPVFVGIGPEADVEAYLGGVERSVVTELDREPRYEDEPGRAPASPPGEQEFWVASVSGAGEQTLEWEPEEGDWRVVAMNADGSRGVETELSIGAELDPLLWIGIGLLVLGAVLAAAAALAITAGARRRHPG
jgi:hypothetical protein